MAFVSFRFTVSHSWVSGLLFKCRIVFCFVFSEEQVQSTQAPQFDVGLVAGMSVFVIVLIVVIIVSLYYVR